MQHTLWGPCLMEINSAVPGEIRGLEYIHTKYGVLDWAIVLQPAIKVAREGFAVTHDLARAINTTIKNGKSFLSDDPSWALDFAPNGTLLGLGDTIYRTRYADTLELIANQGADSFYSGFVAESMIQAIQEANGTMTMEDLQAYQVVVRDTEQIDYRGYKITSTSAPSSGTVGLSILKILDGYDDFFSPETTHLSTHRLNEAIRFGYGQVCLVQHYDNPCPHLTTFFPPFRGQASVIHRSCQVYTSASRTC